MSEPNRHHYIPVFYLKQWIGSDGRLCEYSRPHQVVKAKRKHPAATGYVDGLYTIPGLPPEQTQYVEKRYMQATDDWAAKALKVFLNPGGPTVRDLNVKEKIGWARFLYSLIVRTPEHLARMQNRIAVEAPAHVEEFRDNYESIRKPSDPATFEEFKQLYLANPLNTSAPNMLPYLMRSERIIIEIGTMRFFTIDIRDAKHSFLTSDRPIAMTNGLNKPTSHIAIPLSPKRLFGAVKSQETYDAIGAMRPNELVVAVNAKVAEQARKYVYGTDDSQLRFVVNRLGKMVQSTPLG